MSEPVYVGIDVAKASFEVAASGEEQTLSLGNDEAGHAELCQVLVPLAPRLILLEATGGHERLLALALAAAGLRVSVINPRQARTSRAARASWPRPIASTRRCCAASPPCWTRRVTSRVHCSMSSSANSPRW